ncbi:MAG: beta-lactamase family protein [Chitinophagaceae bacterium]|nr:beta-lactamase family protein [Chitinophagaceae bacterium]OQY93407.1 MAG: serine hydrolase [Sphingobacteriales bacterium UTBCD1]
MLSYLLVFCPGSIVFSQQQKTESRIDSVMKQFDMVGLSVAVVKHGQIIYAHSFGLKNRETNTPLSNSDIFRIASISKSFSSTSIMQLASEGKLSLRDDVSDLIGFKVRNPKYPDKAITLKMLLSHTSSLNDDQGYFTLDVINPDKNPDWAKCYSDYAPGEKYSYCNLNFNMVGTIIERTSGQRFDKYVKQHVLDPLELYGGYEVGALDSTKFVTLYEYDPQTKTYTADPAAYNPRKTEIENYVQGYSTPIFSPTGGMKISATGLAKYMTMHMYFGKYGKVRIIKKKWSHLMQTPVLSGYGLALLTSGDLIPGKTMVGHTGSAYGLYSLMFFQPKEKFGIVAITNGCNKDSDVEFNPALKAVANVLYEELIK